MAENQPIQEEVWICAANLSGACPIESECGDIHHKVPYLWQVKLDQSGWTSLQDEAVVMKLEMAYCTPASVGCNIQIPVWYNDGHAAATVLQVDFGTMMAHIEHPAERWAEQKQMQLKRLSTRSYAYQPLNQKTGTSPVEPPAAACCWCWYYDDRTTWKLFEEDEKTPMQYVLETKYLAGQKIYRFELDMPDSSNQFWNKTSTVVFLLNFPSMSITNLMTNMRCSIRRRPVFVHPNQCTLRNFLPFPEVKRNQLYSTELPSTWFPIDHKAEYELVPLDPTTMNYHVVASELVKLDLPDTPKWKIMDIYRLQNVYLWHKFYSKKLYMEQKMTDANELLLFHGTSAETSVQAIFKQNFDWRLSGKNAVAFGEGSYFARSPTLSDKYTGGADVPKTRWMFLARVLIGKSAVGKMGYKRPPPLDTRKPHGDLYDSCVNKLKDPTIYVVFDNDQCYPEYVIAYTR